MINMEKVIGHIEAEIGIARTCKKDFASVDVDMLSDALSLLKEQRAIEQAEVSNRPEKRIVEFIESYWTGGEYGSNYRWNDNHGELVRCKDCERHLECDYWIEKGDEWFCADGKRRGVDNVS